MPFVLLVLPPGTAPPDVTEDGDAAMARDVAGAIAQHLGLTEADVLVQLVHADTVSAPVATALLAGRPRAGMESATEAVARYLAERLDLDRDAVLVRFEPTSPPITE